MIDKKILIQKLEDAKDQALELRNKLILEVNKEDVKNGRYHSMHVDSDVDELRAVCCKACHFYGSRQDQLLK